MFSIMSLLLYFNLVTHRAPKDSASPPWRRAVSIWRSSSAALCWRSPCYSSAVATRIGLRNAMTGGMALVAVASALVGAAVSGRRVTLLAIGFFCDGRRARRALCRRRRDWRCRPLSPTNSN